MTRKSRDHYIGDDILEALRRISEESEDWGLNGRHPSEVDYSVEYHGGNHLFVQVNE